MVNSDRSPPPRIVTPTLLLIAMNALGTFSSGSFCSAVVDSSSANTVFRSNPLSESIVALICVICTTAPNIACEQALGSKGFPASTPYICGLRLLLVLSSAPKGYFSGTPVFPSLKNQHFQTRLCIHFVDVPLPNYLLIYLFTGRNPKTADWQASLKNGTR